MPDPVAPILTQRGYVLLDGGLATELERRGLDLRDPLWSAKALLEAPELVRRVHLDYYRAGADVAVTASYQATFPGLRRRGLAVREIERVLRASVDLARSAREEFLAGPEAGSRVPPLVAASIGPYGAFLHDGSEYRGDYGISGRELTRFHRDRLTILAGSGADLLALETIPSRAEAEVLVELLEQGAAGDTPAWVSFSCRDERRISDGSPFAECVRAVQGSERVVAVGMNCTAPRFVSALLESAAEVATRPLVAYPNSGETYDAATGTWGGTPNGPRIPDLAPEWLARGARLIGGCCRTTPDTIRAITERLAAAGGTGRDRANREDGGGLGGQSG